MNDARQFLASIPILPLHREAAERTAELRRDLERKGQYIGMGDSLIAGIALTRTLPLFTRNRKHFERAPNLKLIEVDYAHWSGMLPSQFTLPVGKLLNSSVSF